ncbi:MAG: hypothetical protein ACOZQL_05570 [Myxococcota bacterium]
MRSPSSESGPTSTIARLMMMTSSLPARISPFPQDGVELLHAALDAGRDEGGA